MRYAVSTFGCRVNQADSLQLEAELRGRGAVRAPVEEADVVVVNTCSVTASADQGTRQTLRRVARLNPEAQLLATGCYATRASTEIEALPGAPLVVPNDEKHTIAARVLGEPDSTTADRYGDGAGACGAPVTPGLVGRVAFMLRVQTGCDQPCAYCVIPMTRGRGRSLALSHVGRAVNHAEQGGFHEIVLTGVHLGSFGRDLEPSSSLIELLRFLDRHPSNVRFRISSLEPMDCPPALIDLVAASGRFVPHFHLPLQHASDRILRRMRRPYTLAQYAETVDRIRHLLPDAAIGSDLIAGYPGESEDDAQRTLDYVAGSPLTYLHVFPYSARPNTEAAALSGRVAGPMIRARAQRLRVVGGQLAAAFRQRQIGREREAIALDAEGLVLTDNYLKVRVLAGVKPNSLLRVRIDSAEPLTGVVS